jgi:hypothetical protein
VLKNMALLVVLTVPFAAMAEQFQTPSGNIHCIMFENDPSIGPAEVRCDMVELTQSYTKPPPDCDLDYGTSFYVAADSASGGLTCHGDTIILPSMDILPCSSESSGLTCTNASGAGFTLTRAQQTLF